MASTKHTLLRRVRPNISYINSGDILKDENLKSKARDPMDIIRLERQKKNTIFNLIQFNYLVLFCSPSVAPILYIL